MSDLPASAQVVIIGGGIVGCSTAYHLGAMGSTRCCCSSAHRLSSGSTWHAAGLVGQLRTNANVTQLLGYSVALYDRLEAETGLATGWKRNGGLRLACTPERWTEVKRQATTARSFGLEMQLLTPAEAQDLWPLMTVDDVVGAAFLPTDGQASPSDIVQALAPGRAHAAASRSARASRVTGIARRGRPRHRGRDRPGLRRLRQGRLLRRPVVARGRPDGRRQRAAGQRPAPVPHHRARSRASPPACRRCATPTGSPTTRRRSAASSWAATSRTRSPGPSSGIPEGFEFQLLDDDWDHFEPMMELALGRVPALETAGVKQFINGPESFTPDGNFILGEAPEVAGFFVGAGFNAFGIASGGGAGMALAEWVATGAPPYDLWAVDIRRFGRNHLSTPLGADPHARSLRQALRDGLAARGIRLRPAAAPLAALRPAGGQGRGLRREARLGTAELVRRRRARRRATSTPSGGRTGSRRSAASTGPAARRRRSSTRPRSPSS